MQPIKRDATDLTAQSRGFGGCPMAKDDLTGNMPTEKLLSYFTAQKANTNLKPMSFESAFNKALEVFEVL